MKFRVGQTPTVGGMTAMVLEDAESGARAELVPERGALVSRFSVRGEPALYLDERTLADRSQNVRGGIPVLFPCAGKLPDGAYEVQGQRYALRQHGFARNRAWTVKRVDTDDAARVVCALEDDAESRAVFPFAFGAELEVSVREARLHWALELTSRAPVPLPVHLGLHPYFFVPDAEKARVWVETAATRSFDNRTGREGPLPPLDFTADELDQHLLDHGADGTVLLRGGLPPLRLSWSAAFGCLVLWTLRGRDFVCVEPWTAPAGALASGKGLLWLSPGERRRWEFAVRVGET